MASQADDTGHPALNRDHYRILDANANRTCEALRVIEDVARFVANDKFLSSACKDLRHDLLSVLHAVVPSTTLLAGRDTLNDVGTTITAGGEYARGGLDDLLASNFKRTQQGLRVLEECCKLESSILAQQLEQLRYRAYTLELATRKNGQARARFAEVRLIVLIDSRGSLSAFGELVRAIAISPQVMLQLRDKSLSDAELRDRAQRLVELTRERQVLAIVNDRPDIAALTGADGVHLGQTDLAIQDARRILPPRGIVGRSSHSLDQARQAVIEGADYLGVGPVFPSVTKAFTELPGLALVREVTEELSLPSFAIGGITPENLHQVRESGMQRVAVHAAVANAEDPQRVVEELLGSLQ